jgi:soluble lytic murein transglycosylase-like protein
MAAIRHGIDPAMIHAIIMAESSFNPDAVSNRGAQGLMQLMPQTAESLGLADAFDPGKNIDAGARYFRQLLNQFRGDVELALAAYNAGIQSVINHNGVPPFKTTQRYVRKVLDYYEHYRRMLTG